VRLARPLRLPLTERGEQGRRPKEQATVNPIILHPEVVLGLPKEPPIEVVVATGSILVAMDGNAGFPEASAELAAAIAAHAAYAKAVTDAKNKMPGAVTARAEAKVALFKTLEPLRLIVQTAVDAHLDQAATIAESAKMRLRKAAAHTKADFAVKDGLGKGQALLVARAVDKGVLYFWELSLDQMSWSVALDTTGARALLTALTAGQTYYFRFRARTRTGMTDYSQVLSHMVR
jgi:hypothetical protein